MAEAPRRVPTAGPDDCGALVDEAVVVAERWIAATDLERWRSR